MHNKSAIFKALNDMSMGLNGDSHYLDTLIKATVPGSDCYIITSRGNTYIEIQNNWVVENRHTTWTGNKLLNDRVNFVHSIQVRSNLPNTITESDYKHVKVGKSWATAKDIV